VRLQRITMPWRLIDSADSARALAEDLRRRPLTEERRTWLSAALLFSASLFPATPTMASVASSMSPVMARTNMGRR
jgi:hypothetical protein